MKIAVLDYIEGDVSILDVEQKVLDGYDTVEDFLLSQGWNLDSINWMTMIKSLHFEDVRVPT